ncbi:MAG: DUF4387 domain-containing protein [Armatimonadetes bacterium]|nr:DUF4387 domain-containing protein [Armatimonadota bacterium]
MRLYDLARVLRSKNAGPFALTLDLMFETEEDFDRVLNANVLEPATIGRLYRVAPADVLIRPFRRIRTIKITLPRAGASSGAPDDRDVYGSQQHFPLADLEV